MTIPDDARTPVESWIRLLAALETDCTVCGGTGRVLSKIWQEWRERAEELTRVAQAAQRAVGLRPDQRARTPASHSPKVMAAIERALIEHERSRPAGPEQVPCESCRGCGKMLTGMGERVADLLSRHGFVRDIGPPDPWR